MHFREARKLTLVLVILGVITMWATNLYRPLFIIGLLVILSSLIPELLYNKCPHCGKHLGKQTGPFCQNCGKKLD